MIGVTFFGTGWEWAMEMDFALYFVPWMNCNIAGHERKRNRVNSGCKDVVPGSGLAEDCPALGSRYMLGYQSQHWTRR